MFFHDEIIIYQFDATFNHHIITKTFCNIHTQKINTFTIFHLKNKAWKYFFFIKFIRILVKPPTFISTFHSLTSDKPKKILKFSNFARDEAMKNALLANLFLMMCMLPKFSDNILCLYTSSTD